VEPGSARLLLVRGEQPRSRYAEGPAPAGAGFRGRRKYVPVG